MLRGLGPWKESVYLVGGLTPRYLVKSRPPKVPAHAGTLDVDIVIDLQILANTDVYHTLEENLKRMKFERAENDKQQKLSWSWQACTERGALIGTKTCNKTEPCELEVSSYHTSSITGMYRRMKSSKSGTVNSR